MPKRLYTLGLAQLDQRLGSWRPLSDDPPPRGGWLRAIREALGMTTGQLAKRIGVAQQTVVKLERSEAAGKITLQSLRRVAEALNCRVVYAVVPNASLGKMRRERALALADSLIKPVAHSMRLEAQDVEEEEMRRQRDELADEFLRGNPRKLWR